MTVQHQATATVTGTRRADAGTVRMDERDMAGLLLCGEQYGAPYDLLAAALDVQPARLRGIVARWRAAGYAVTGRLGPARHGAGSPRPGWPLLGWHTRHRAEAGPPRPCLRGAGRPAVAGIGAGIP
ncbi:MAG TPA: hypothetical protein VN969_37880 [Streptosporangiaceae bacterium]|nr:hypothetical protein [Streptosporangiaceae bacterium]